MRNKQVQYKSAKCNVKHWNERQVWNDSTKEASCWLILTSATQMMMMKTTNTTHTESCAVQRLCIFWLEVLLYKCFNCSWSHSVSKHTSGVKKIKTHLQTNMRPISGILHSFKNDNKLDTVKSACGLSEHSYTSITAAGDHVTDLRPRVQVGVIDFHRVYSDRRWEVPARGPTSHRM